MIKKILIDCDPGVDDSLAILFALYRKDVEIAGITTGIGNVTAAQGAENALRILKLAGAEDKIPVCAGAECTIAGETEEFPEFIHGKNGIGNVELPGSQQKTVEKDVCDFIYEKACQYEHELVLVLLGRMTNIANTIKKYPDFPKKIKQVVAMGGAVGTFGNVGPEVEANIGGDPEAADIVVQAAWDVTMVGLDVTMNTHLRMQDVEEACRYCREECRPVLEFAKNELEYYMEGARKQNWMRGCCPFHDPLAMIVAVNPGVVFTQKRITRIECDGKYTRGKVVTDLREYPIEGRYVTHCLQVDSVRALNEFFAVFQ